MKLLIKIIAPFSMLILVYASTSTYAQHNKFPNLRYQDEKWRLWSIEANSGLLSFYGDLSSYDGNYIYKIIHESGTAFSLNLTKHFDRLFALSGQLMLGKLQGNHNESSFNAELIEYNLNLKLNIFNLFYPVNSGNFGITAQSGIGQFYYNSTQSATKEGKSEVNTHKARVPEFTYFVGAGSFFKLNENIGITMDISLRQCQSDWLDVVVRNNDYDYFSYLSFGLVYYLQNNLKKGPIKNKARIAHNNQKLKHL